MSYRMITNQTYVEGMGCTDIDFFTQFMGASIIKSKKLDDPDASPEELLRRLHTVRDPYYLTMKQASLIMPNGRVAQVSTQHGDGSYHADAWAGTYEVLDRSGGVGEDRRIETNVSADEVMRILLDMAKGPPARGVTHPLMRALRMPAVLYDRTLHGRFIHDDYANYEPDLKANRILIGYDSWTKLRGRFGMYCEPVRAINEWCEENCVADFAWTTCGPIWTFRDHRDAFNFRIAWG